MLDPYRRDAPVRPWTAGDYLPVAVDLLAIGA